MGFSSLVSYCPRVAVWPTVTVCAGIVPAASGARLGSGVGPVVPSSPQAHTKARLASTVHRVHSRPIENDLLRLGPSYVFPPASTHLGERGEFHSCLLDGPMFSSPIAVRPGRVVRRPVATASGGGGTGGQECIYADLVACSAIHVAFRCGRVSVTSARALRTPRAFPAPSRDVPPDRVVARSSD